MPISIYDIRRAKPQITGPTVTPSPGPAAKPLPKEGRKFPTLARFGRFLQKTPQVEAGLFRATRLSQLPREAISFATRPARLVTGLVTEDIRSKGRGIEMAATPAGRAEFVQSAKRVLQTKPSLKTLQEPAVEQTFNILDIPLAAGVARLGLKGLARLGGKRVVKEATEKITPKVGRELEERAVREPLSIQEKLPGIPKEKLPAKTVLKGEAETLARESRTWKDLPRLALPAPLRTTVRNIESVVGKSAPKVKRFLSEFVDRQETARLQFLQEKFTKFSLLSKELGIAKGGFDDKLVHRFGERLDKRGRLTGKALAQLKEETTNWQNVIRAIKEFRREYDELLDLINAERKRFGYQEIVKRKNYFRHFQQLTEEARLRGIISGKGKLPAPVVLRGEFFRPGKPFTTAELARKGGKTTFSAFGGMENYLESISRQLFHLEGVQRGRALVNALRKTEGEGKRLSDFLGWLDEYVNQVAGKRSIIDRAIEKRFGPQGRMVLDTMSYLSRRVGLNMIAGNIRSALTNFYPFVQTLSTTDPAIMLRGLIKGLEGAFGDFAKIDDVSSSFLIRRRGAGLLAPTKIERGAEAISSPFLAVDRYVARSVVAAKYYEALRLGKNSKEAIKYADEWAARIVADRSLGQLPLAFREKTLKPFTMFQVEVVNLLDNLGHDIPRLYGGDKRKIAQALTQFSLFSYAFNEGFEKLTGRRMALDPIHLATTMLGLSETGEGKEFEKRLLAASKELSENLPLTGSIFGGRIPIAETIPDIPGMLRGEKEVKRELLTSVLPFFSPVGGGVQAKKTLEGREITKRGFAVSPKAGEFKFPVGKDILSRLQALVFGQYAGKGARFYFNRSLRPLSRQQESIWKNATQSGQSPYQAWATVLRTRVVEGHKDNVKRIARGMKREKDTWVPLAPDEVQTELDQEQDQFEFMMRLLDSLGGQEKPAAQLTPK